MIGRGRKCTVAEEEANKLAWTLHFSCFSAINTVLAGETGNQTTVESGYNRH